MTYSSLKKINKKTTGKKNKRALRFKSKPKTESEVRLELVSVRLELAELKKIVIIKPKSESEVRLELAKVRLELEKVRLELTNVYSDFKGLQTVIITQSAIAEKAILNAKMLAEGI